jgi:hypothetical protein
VLNLANPRSLILEHCRPDILALCICQLPALESIYYHHLSRHHPRSFFLSHLACYAASVVTRDFALPHGHASRQYGTRQRPGTGGFPATTFLHLLPKHTPSRILCPQWPAEPIHTASTAVPVPARTSSVPSLTTCRGEEAISSLNLESARDCWW